MPSPKGISLFTTATWIIALAGGFALICLPLLQNAWAARHWQAVPCEIRGNAYAFDYQGKRYVATRRDFWDGTLNSIQGVPRFTDLHPDDTCYISPGEPESPVLHLDAYKRWDLALKPIFLTAFLICAAALVTWKTRRPHRRRKN